MEIAESPSSRGRGLKLAEYRLKLLQIIVALFTRAWIEIINETVIVGRTWVALFTRAWIEMVAEFYKNKKFLSRPLHEGVD